MFLLSMFYYFLSVAETVNKINTVRSSHTITKHKPLDIIKPDAHGLPNLHNRLQFFSL
jgi:hypothetical protein